MLRLILTFALAAILIATIGLYGLISYSVAQRTREFGMLLALGARRVAVLRLVLGEGLRLAAIGAAGIAGALALLRVMQSMLYGVSATARARRHGACDLHHCDAGVICAGSACDARRSYDDIAQ